MFLPFFCPLNIYRPSQGKVRLGRPNPKQIQPLNFYLWRNQTIPFYSELYGLQCIAVRFSIFIFIYLKKNILKNVSKNLSKYWTIYIIIIASFFFKGRYIVVNTILNRTFFLFFFWDKYWVIDIGLKLLKTQLLGNAFEYDFNNENELNTHLYYLY